MLMKERNVMRSVKMNTKELLNIVRANKEKHDREFLESVQDYLTVARKVSKDNIRITKANSMIFESATNLDEIKTISTKSLPRQPRSYTDEYSRAIRMLELEVEPVVEIEDHVFNQLVLDEWSWKNEFTASSALYKTMV